MTTTPMEPATGETELRRYFEELRDREFARLDEGGHVYLDYTGSGLYAECQVRDHDVFLEHHVLGNPHSENPASAVATRLLEDARAKVLEFFCADPDEYTVAFTSNASAALKLVGESFPFTHGSRLVLLEDNHNSVQGIRVYAEARGAETVYLPLDEELRLAEGVGIPTAADAPSLFAFPGQSNFSGVKHPLTLIAEAKDAGYRTVLDAAAYAPTNRLDLSAVSPDFVSIAFYKMFGLPTGLGALIARRHALRELERPWFAGGTVEFVSVQNRVHRLRDDAEAFEDGTPNFLGIAAMPRGLAFLSEVGMDRVSRHVRDITSRVLDVLASARLPDGSSAVQLYGPPTTEGRGGTVAFNLRDGDGGVVPYGDVERDASSAGISLRGGCFCNPGAAERALDLQAREALECFESIPRGSFTLKRFAGCMGEGHAVGALRVSVGIPTTHSDLDRFEAWLTEFCSRQTAP
ncbi:MAG: aminotransferase class V-fold PLP-dependent enzyme [Longimicrobiales bacterium]|nr:aminotransferase class V-fold PLP-dependent enzyme [Longimicrobiales bacterium]